LADNQEMGSVKKWGTSFSFKDNVAQPVTVEEMNFRCPLSSLAGWKLGDVID
jgi:hypothetical protein